MTEPSERDRLAVLAHEVRSPAAALAAISEAYPEPTTDDLDRRALASLAVAACHALERIVLDASLTTVRSEPLDPAALVNETVSAARLRGRRVEASVDHDLPRAWGDHIRLRQALDNLVDNAVAWSPPGEAVVVGARGADGALVLFVSDRGPGVLESQRERIFQHGTRLDVGRPGAGIGLAVVRAIAEAHGGSAAVEDATGNGATFRIRLPAPDRGR